MNARPFRGRLGHAGTVFFITLSVTAFGFTAVVAVVHKGFEALAGSRAYVEGEAHWSKAQKDAVYHLLRYALLEDDEGYDRFREELDVIHGDREFRIELESAEPDMDRARDGLLRGRNHAEDVDVMVNFFQSYRDIHYVDRAIAAWVEGDELVDELEAVAERIREAREAGAGPDDMRVYLEEVDELNRRLTILETEFSRALSEGARWARSTLFLVVVATAGGLFILTGILGWILTLRIRRSEAALRASEERYRGLYENAPLGIYRTDRDQRIVEANPALFQMLGESDKGSLVGEDACERFRCDRWVNRAEDDLVRVDDVETKGPGGRPIVVSLAGRVLMADGETAGYEVFVEDVTEKRVLQAQVQEAQKMGAIGRVTWEVAESLKNLLTTILLSTGSVRQAIHQGRLEPALDALEPVEDAVARGEAVANKLLLFSRHSSISQSEVNLVGLVSDARPRVAHVLPSSVEVRFRLEESCPPVQGDPLAFEDILFNLVTNAGDAMPDGGVLEIGVEVRDGALGVNAQTLLGEEKQVVLRVADNGIGMANEVLERAFEPFVTTKEVHAGRGLGLAVVHYLVRLHGGVVRMGSEEGKGTEVEVVLRPAPVRKGPSGRGTGGAGRWDDSETSFAICF